MRKIIEILLISTVVLSLSSCFLITTPVKVAGDTVSTAADVV